MITRLFSLLLTLSLLTACVPYRNIQPEQMTTLPLSYSNYDAGFAWNVIRRDNITLIEGFVRNVRYFEMADFEVRVSLLDEEGNETALRAVDFIIPTNLKRDEIAAFNLKFQGLLKPGAKLRFFYHYKGFDGGGDDEGYIREMHSFDSALP